MTTFKCTVCSEIMFPIKRFRDLKKGNMIKMKCTCGHVEDISDRMVEEEIGEQGDSINRTEPNTEEKTE
jgi:hypothetical protein